MRFFTKSPKIELGLLWGHLHAIGENNEVSTTPKFEHTYDIIMSALNGSFNLYQTDFNHIGYEMRSMQRDGHTKTAKVKKELNIVDRSLGNMEESVGYGDVTESKVLVNYEEAFEQIDSSGTLRRGIEELVEWRTKIQNEVGLDVIVGFSQSLNGHPGAMAVIREICEHEPHIRELITDILQSSATLSKGGEEIDLQGLIDEHSDRR